MVPTRPKPTVRLQSVDSARRGSWPSIAWGCLALALASSTTTHAAEHPQATQLRARHVKGQTFLTWKEADPPLVDSFVSIPTLLDTLKRAGKAPGAVRYRLYRSPSPITGLSGLKPLAEVGPLTCWNPDYYGQEPRGDKPALRYVIEEAGEPLAAGMGLYVHNPAATGNAYYAVTRVVDGVENTNLRQGNTLADSVAETQGPGVPVLQRIEKPKQFVYINAPTVHYFVRWESPPNSTVENRPIDYLVAVPPKPAEPAPVGIHLHAWGGSLNGGYGWWFNGEKGHIMLASNQVPYDWWTGHHESYGVKPQTESNWRGGIVRPYTQRRLFSFLDWMHTRWNIDIQRTHVAGVSMGGSGSPMLAIRHPDRIAWAASWVGVHVPAKSPTFASAYRSVYGDPAWNLPFEDGTPAWDHFNDAWYLRRHPEKEIGLIVFSNGRNDAGIGWAQAVEFFRALQETRRPHVFSWGMQDHRQRALMPVSLGERTLPIDVRLDQSLPAFTRCSLDDRVGDGRPEDGDPKGQANLYLSWETQDIVDEADRWGMTMGLIPKSPQPSCTVDVTPRRRQRFHTAPGERVKWTVTAPGEPVQTGGAAADQHGVLTLEGVKLTRARHRVEITR